MSDHYRRVFFAFPSQPADLRASIEAAGSIVAARNKSLGLTLWPATDVFGAVVPDEIRKEIWAADVVACDVTRPNLNVYYEVGFAIGAGKAVAPVVNVSFEFRSR